MKYYAVKTGKQTGIFTNWDECKKSVNGFSGAVYKSFKSEKEALEYLNGATNTVNASEVSEIAKTSPVDSNTAIAYCDGSYNDDIKKFSYGVVVMYDGKEYEFAKAFNVVDESRNVTGEIFGAMKAMQFCLDNNIKALDLYYDYAGIEAWATGNWKANKELTKKYANFCKALKDKLNVNFIKVQAHTGVELNERADKLAKAALGL